MKYSFDARIFEALVVIGRALALLVCEKNRPKGLELLDKLNDLEGLNE